MRAAAPLLAIGLFVVFAEIDIFSQL